MASTSPVTLKNKLKKNLEEYADEGDTRAQAATGRTAPDAEQVNKSLLAGALVPGGPGGKVAEEGLAAGLEEGMQFAGSHDMAEIVKAPFEEFDPVTKQVEKFVHVAWNGGKPFVYKLNDFVKRLRTGELPAGQAKPVTGTFAKVNDLRSVNPK